MSVKRFGLPLFFLGQTMEFGVILILPIIRGSTLFGNVEVVGLTLTIGQIKGRISFVSGFDSPIKEKLPLEVLDPVDPFKGLIGINTCQVGNEFGTFN